MSLKKQYEVKILDISFYDNSPFSFMEDFVLGTFKSIRKAEDASWGAIKAEGVLSYTIRIRRMR